MADEIDEEIVNNEDSDIVTDSVTIELADDSPEVDAESDDVTVEDGDVTVTVVNDGDDDAVEAVVVAETIDQAVAIANLQRDMDALSGRVATLEVAAIVENAEDEAQDDEIEELADDMEDVADEDEPDSGELDILPPSAEPASAGAHPLFRGWGDWKRGK